MERKDARKATKEARGCCKKKVARERRRRRREERKERKREEKRRRRTRLRGFIGKENGCGANQRQMN